MRYEQQQAQRMAHKREEIVMRAAELFLQHGVPAVSMTQIAAACEMGVATLYRYFGTKAGILVEAGALLWADLARLFEGIFETDGYRDKPGMQQIEELLSFFLLLYRDHKPFLRFVRQFDAFVLQENLPAQALAAYETGVLNLYPLFERAYQKACEEHTARPGLPAKLLYSSVSHALISTSQKFLEGNVLFEDQNVDKAAELSQLIDMALCYLTAKETLEPRKADVV